MDKFRVLRGMDIQVISAIIEGLGIRYDIGKLVTSLIRILRNACFPLPSLFRRVLLTR